MREEIDAVEQGFYQQELRGLSEWIIQRQLQRCTLKEEGGGGQCYERPPLSPCFSNTTPALWYLDLDLVENEAKVHSMTALKTETEM